MTISAFRFAPDPAMIADLRERLSRSRIAASAPDPEGRMGLDPRALERLASAFRDLDWDGFAERVNRYPAFVTESDGERLHFVHARSECDDAVPLLLLHGWPGSFLEFGEIIPMLVAGGRPFHIVCPSLPGYGFSTRRLDRPCNTTAIADRIAALMQSLGYSHYLVQGGDWGSLIASEIARRHPHQCIGLHLNFVAIQPPPADDPALAAIEPEESKWLDRNRQNMASGMGYYAIQSTRPQTLAVALADSPLGLLAWLGEKYLAWSDADECGRSLMSDQAILDQVALYWLTASIGSSIRLYHDDAVDRPAQTPVAVPTGVAIFPAEIIRTPRAWAARRFNLVHWRVQPRGGHFAALEVPDLLARDICEFAERIMETVDAGA